MFKSQDGAIFASAVQTVQVLGVATVSFKCHASPPSPSLSASGPWTRRNKCYSQLREENSHRLTHSLFFSISVQKIPASRIYTLHFIYREESELKTMLPLKQSKQEANYISNKVSFCDHCSIVRYCFWKLMVDSVTL